MNQYRKSFLKTTLLAFGCSLSLILLAYLFAHFLLHPGSGVWRAVVLTVGWALAAPAALTGVGGMLVLMRDSDQRDGKPDLFFRLNEQRSEAALLTGAKRLFRWPRLSRTWSPRVGEVVEVLSWDEIRRTLDSSGSLAGMPFQEEMRKFCGRRARVYRGIDKIYDFGRTKTLKRLKDTVLLTGFRCDGDAHDGCQAGCYLMWKTAWLKPAKTSGVNAPVALSGQTPSPAAHRNRPGKAPASAGTAGIRDRSACYRCQFTELASASTSMNDWDLRQDVRPLLSGNVTLPAFCVFALTRLFNFAQRLRGGVGFPVFTPAGNAITPVADLHLMPGERARVLAPEQIARTLNARSRNRGLWFDVDMLKNAGKTYEVLKRVERIIDDATGRMIEMKTPCIVLDGVDCSGEFLRLSAQHDYTYWREAWLAREGTTKEKTGVSDHSGSCDEAVPVTTGVSTNA